MSFLAIKDMHEDERPREKMQQMGPGALSNTELLAILINTGTKDLSALDVARNLLKAANHDLLALGRLTLADLQKMKGLGVKKAVTIMACLELGKRRQLAQAKEQPVLNSSKLMFEYFSSFFMDRSEEMFYVLFLNNACMPLAVEKISEGGVASTTVDVRVIFKKVFQYTGVTRIVLAHNHPSGKVSPSRADIEITNRIREASNFFDIDLLDHLIIGHNQYYSFRDSGIL